MTIQRQTKLSYINEEGDQIFYVAVHDGKLVIGANDYTGAYIPLEYIEEFTNMMSEVLADANVES